MNIATSIFRFAVKRTVLLTSEGIGLPSGVVPVVFLCHLAEILRLDLTDAVLIIYAETASKLRDALLQVWMLPCLCSSSVRGMVLQVCADVRGSGQMMPTNGFVVRSVIRLLGALPLRIDDAELIGSSITLSTTEKARAVKTLLASHENSFSGPGTHPHLFKAVRSWTRICRFDWKAARKVRDRSQ